MVAAKEVGEKEDTATAQGEDPWKLFALISVFVDCYFFSVLSGEQD